MESNSTVREMGFEHPPSDPATKNRRAAATSLALLRASAVGTLVLLASGGAAPVPPGHVSIAYAYTHVRVNCPQPQAGGGGGADETDGRGHKAQATSSSDNIILHYDQPAIRALVDSTLKAMRASADALRMHVWISGGDLDNASGPQMRLGLLSSKANVPPNVLNNVTNIVKTAASLGYSKIYFVFGQQGSASPKCGWRKQSNCFDSSNLGGDWNIRKEVIDAARQGSTSGTSVYFDLSGESCPGGAVSAAMRTNLEQFTAYLVKQYATTYHDDHSYISCHGKTLNRTVNDLDSIVAVYRAAGIRPHTLDVHMYPDDEQTAEAILEHAESDAQSLGTHVSVLESAYDSTPVFAAIKALRQRNAIPQFETLGIWPKTLEASCTFSIQWPKDLSSVSRALN